MKSRFSTTVAGVALGAAVLSAASTPPVTSQPLSDSIHVDGVITDWSTLTAVSKEINLAAANNTDRLCLAIATSSAEVKQQLQALGLNVFLDPNGKKGETFGVHIPPIGGGGMARGRYGSGSGGQRGGYDPNNPPPAPAPSAPGSSSAHTPSYIEVIGPVESERHIVELTQPKGFALATGDNAGTFLIELAIPLREKEDTPYALPLIDGKSTIGIGLVAPAATHGSNVTFGPGGGGGGGGRGGGMGGGMGGMGGGMGGGRGGGGMPQGGPGMGGEKTLKIWTTLALSTK